MHALTWLQMMFERMAQVDENYFLCDMGEQKVNPQYNNIILQ